MRIIKFRILSVILTATLVALVAPTKALAVVQNLNGQTGQIQTFQNDTNVTVSSSNDVHSLGWQGLLPLSRGGTGANSFTAGSLLFSNGTSISQDNSDLFWDYINKRLGIGTSEPTTTLDVIGNASVSGDLEVNGNIISTNLVPYTGANADVNLGTKALILDGNDNLNYISIDNTNFNLFLNQYGLSQLGSSTQDPYITLGANPGIELAFDSPAGATEDGDSITITANAGGGTSGAGGSIILTAGSATAGNSNGGNISFVVGAKTGSGTNGAFQIQTGGTGIKAILDASSLAASDKTFTFPNATGTFGLLEANQTWKGLNKFEASTNSTIYVGSSVKSGCIAMGDSDSSGVTYVTANDGVLSASATKPSICQ